MACFCGVFVHNGCSKELPFPGQRDRGAGSATPEGDRGRTLLKRALPLRPPPETWGRFDFAPTPPNDIKGRGCGPSPLDSPPGDKERQRVAKRNARGQKDRPFVNHPESKPAFPNAGKQISVSQGYSALGTSPQVCAAPATTTPAFAVNLTQRCQVEPPRHFFFSTVHGAFSF